MSFRLWSLIAVSLLVAAACGDDSTAGAAADGGDGQGISIESPADGDEVTLPLKVEVATSVDIGPEESGKDHWHLFVDGEELEYSVETSNEAMLDDLSPGDHTINATLQHADHSSAGASDEITVTVTGGATGGGDEEESGTDPGYDY
jgi:hypothetical protein